MEAFIRSKYERKQYLKKDGLPPNKPTSNPAAKETKSIDKVRNFDLQVNTFNLFKRVIIIIITVYLYSAISIIITIQ